MVEGTVTFHGRPLAGGTVTFIPAPGSENKLEPGIARIESDGSYWIGNANLSKPAGLVPGKYKVTVLKMRTDPNGIRMQTPAIYADSRTTPWEFAVEAGRNRIRLDIEEPVTAPESDDSKVAAQFNDERK